MKKLLVVGIILLLVGVSIPSTGRVLDKSNPLSVEGNVLYVGGSGPGNYTKIQDAIDNASDGDTVFVYNGAYVENLVINTSISLIGEDRNTTIVNGGGSGDVIYVSADWVNISGFTLKNGGTTGRCLMIESSNNNILNNNMVNSKSKGYLYIVGSNNSVIGNNISHIGSDYGGGIYFSSNNSNFSNNIVSNHFYGFIGFDTFNLYGNVFSNCYKGIISELSIDNSVFCDNVFLNIKADAIYIRWFRGNKIIKNRFLDNNNCMYLGNGGNNIISQNVFQNNTLCMNIWSSENINISGNAFIDNRDVISLFSSNSNKIYHNNFINNRVNAHFGLLSFYNNWEGNYWGRPRLLPKPIIGSIGLFVPTLINFDWHPAQEPYDIGG